MRADEPLARRTTLRVGGPADFYVEPASEEDLSEVVLFCRGKKIPVTVLGRGSNLLIRDGGIRGVVVCLGGAGFSKIEVEGEKIRAGAGARLKNLAVEARRNNLAGLEFLEGIPGSVGGALRMNAGAMGGAMFDVVESIRFMDGSGAIGEKTRAEIPVAYRSCSFLQEHIALGAVMKGRLSTREAVAERMGTYSQKRWDSQPAQPSAGCIFKNPKEIPAGKLVEELGLKGTRLGGAMVSEIHGNFIINDGTATATDVLKLIDLIKARAEAERGIKLETEVEIVGD